MGVEAQVLNFEPRMPVSTSVEWRHDYYHSNTHVVLVIYISNLTGDQIDVSFESRRVTIRIVQKEVAMLRFKMEHPILPECSKWVLSATKIEVKMAKAAPGSKQWAVQPESE
jgi:hypothetical protein